MNRTSLVSIVLDPFLPWKRAARNWVKARELGFEIVVGLDDRTSKDDSLVVRAMADVVVPFHSLGFHESGLGVVQQATREFVLLVSDDEAPSDLLWKFAADPPHKARYGIPVMPVVGDKLYQLDAGLQERLFYREGWRWVGGFEGHSVGAPKLVLENNPGVIVWHYHLEAPRSDRIAKAARYTSLDGDPATYQDHRARALYEEHPDLLVSLGPLEAFLPKES